MREKWDWNNIIINHIFVFQVAFDIIKIYENPEPQNMKECQHKIDWTKRKETMQVGLNLLTKREIFWSIV